MSVHSGYVAEVGVWKGSCPCYKDTMDYLYLELSLLRSQGENLGDLLKVPLGFFAATYYVCHSSHGLRLVPRCCKSKAC